MAMSLLGTGIDAVKTELPCRAKRPTTKSKDSDFCHVWRELPAEGAVKCVVLTHGHHAPLSVLLSADTMTMNEDCLWASLSVCQPRTISGAGALRDLRAASLRLPERTGK